MLSGSATPEHSTTNLPVAKPSNPQRSAACPTRLSHGFSTLVMPVLSTNSCSLANKSALHRWHEISLLSRHERFKKKEILSVLCLVSSWDLPTLSSLFARIPSRATCTAILQSNNTVSIFKFQDLQKFVATSIEALTSSKMSKNRPYLAINVDLCNIIDHHANLWETTLGRGHILGLVGRWICLGNCRLPPINRWHIVGHIFTNRQWYPKKSDLEPFSVLQDVLHHGGFPRTSTKFQCQQRPRPKDVSDVSVQGLKE